MARDRRMVAFEVSIILRCYSRFPLVELRIPKCKIDISFLECFLIAGFIVNLPIDSGQPGRLIGMSLPGNGWSIAMSTNRQPDGNHSPEVNWKECNCINCSKHQWSRVHRGSAGCLPPGRVLSADCRGQKYPLRQSDRISASAPGVEGPDFSRPETRSPAGETSV